jgi:hypothetical protein
MKTHNDGTDDDGQEDDDDDDAPLLCGRDYSDNGNLTRSHLKLLRPQSYRLFPHC